MTLKTIDLIVADYMSPLPIAVKEDYSFPDAISLMAEEEIGNLVVNKKNQPIGILTEREIIHQLVFNKKIEDIPISKIKLSPFTMINLQSTIIDAARLMISKKTRLLIFDAKKLMGIITATDIVRAFRRTSGNPNLEKVMSKKLYTIKYEDTILKALKIMDQKRIGSVLVLKDDNPFGIFTERDLLVNVLSNDIDVENRVGGYCSSPLVTAQVDIKGGDAARIMAENKIKRLVLTKEGKVSSIVTARDIVDAFQSSFSDAMV